MLFYLLEGVTEGLFEVTHLMSRLFDKVESNTIWSRIDQLFPTRLSPFRWMLTRNSSLLEPRAWGADAIPTDASG
jgi:hypothetical protein